MSQGRTIAEAVVANLRRRRGIRGALLEIEDLYPETYEAMLVDVAGVVDELLDKEDAVNDEDEIRESVELAGADVEVPAEVEERLAREDDDDAEGLDE